MLWGCEAGAGVDTEFRLGAERRKAVDECTAILRSLKRCVCGSRIDLNSVDP